MRLRKVLFLVAATVMAVAVTSVAPGGVASAADTFGQVTNLNSGGCLDVAAEDNFLQIGARIQQYHCTGASEQQWHLRRMGLDIFGVQSPYFQIQSQRSGLCMRPFGGIPGTNGVQISQDRCVNTLSTPATWHFAPYQGCISCNTWVLENVVDRGFCLDLMGGSHGDHVKIEQWTCNGSRAQAFVFSGGSAVPGPGLINFDF